MLQEEEQMLVNMKKILEIAEAEGYAIPCINTPNEETVRAVIGAAEELNTPIIIDHAQVHDSLIPIERIGPIMLKYAKEARVPVCVHLDHGSDYEFVMSEPRRRVFCRRSNCLVRFFLAFYFACFLQAKSV